MMIRSASRPAVSAASLVCSGVSITLGPEVGLGGLSVARRRGARRARIREGGRWRVYGTRAVAASGSVREVRDRMLAEGQSAALDASAVSLRRPRFGRNGPRRPGSETADHAASGPGHRAGHVARDAAGGHALELPLRPRPRPRRPSPSSDERGRRPLEPGTGAVAGHGPDAYPLARLVADPRVDPGDCRVHRAAVLSGVPPVPLLCATATPLTIRSFA